MGILAVVPARGGSKGIVKKNIAKLQGRPLIHYTLEAALKSERIDKIVVSTDCPEIKDVVDGYGVQCINRPSNLSTDWAPSHDVVNHAVNALKMEGSHFDTPDDLILTLQPTSPLRNARHIDEAISYFNSDSNIDSLVSCIDLPHQFHPQSVMRIDEFGYLKPYFELIAPTRRQDKESLLARNGAAIYITRGHLISKFIYGGRLVPYKMSPLESIDIDSADDLELAELFLKNPGILK